MHDKLKLITKTALLSKNNIHYFSDFVKKKEIKIEGVSDMLHNEDIRDLARIKNVRLWQIAEAIGIQDSNFSRLLRKELPENKKKEIFAVIENLSR